MRVAFHAGVKAIFIALVSAVMMFAQPSAAQEPEPGLRISESEFDEHMRVLEIKGLEREAAAAFYREYSDQFEKAWSTNHATIQWLDQMQGDRFGGYPYRQQEFWRTINEDFRSFPRAVKTGGRSLEVDYFGFLAGLTPRFADRVESLRRRHVRERVMRSRAFSESAHGWSFDLLTCVEEITGISLVALIGSHNSSGAPPDAVCAAVREYEQLLQPLVEHIDLMQAGLLAWRDDQRRMTWRVMDTRERPDEREIARYVDGFVEYTALPYEIRALTRAHASRIAALLHEADGRRLLERVERATQPFLYTTELDLARTIAAGALSRSDLSPRQRDQIIALGAQLDGALHEASIRLEAKYDPIISPVTARQLWNQRIRYSIERAINDIDGPNPENPYPLLEAILDEAVLLWAEEVDGHLRNIRAAIGETSP